MSSPKPVYGRHEDLKKKKNPEPDSESVVIRELILAVEYMRCTCEHSIGMKRADIQEGLFRAMSVGIRMNAKHSWRLSDEHLESFWSDVRNLPMSLGLPNINQGQEGDLK